MPHDYMTKIRLNALYPMAKRDTVQLYEPSLSREITDTGRKITEDFLRSINDPSNDILKAYIEFGPNHD